MAITCRNNKFSFFKRSLVNVELQVSGYDDVRSTMKVVLPKGWTLKNVVKPFYCMDRVILKELL